MGIIQKQTIKSTFYSYLGILVGFITSVFLRPHALSTEANGVLELLLSYSTIFVQLAGLGFYNSSVRFFPYFRNPEKNHHGFLALSLLISLVGFLLCTGIFFFAKGFLIAEDSIKMNFFSLYQFPLLIIAFFTLAFNVLDSYNRLMYDTVTGTVLREFLQRLFIALAVLAVIFFKIDFQLFLILWLIANILPTIQIVFRLIRTNNFDLTPDRAFLNKDLVKGMASISTYAVLTGFSTMIIQYIDKIMIADMIGLSATGIYGITVFFGVVISMPSRALYRISGAIIADKWKQNDLQSVQSIYKKSCINQLLIAGLLFIGIWANIHNIFKILPPEYEAGKYVIFFAGLGCVIDMATGVNGTILMTSKYYRYDTYCFIGLIGIVIAANYIFIPNFGIAGAAIAGASATFIFNLFRFVFVWAKFKMQPFGWNNLFILLTAILTLSASWLLPQINNWMIDLCVRSLFITVVYVGIIWFFRLAPEMNELIANRTEKHLGRRIER